MKETQRQTVLVGGDEIRHERALIPLHSCDRSTVQDEQRCKPRCSGGNDEPQAHHRKGYEAQHDHLLAPPEVTEPSKRHGKHGVGGLEQQEHGEGDPDRKPVRIGAVHREQEEEVREVSPGEEREPHQRPPKPRREPGEPPAKRGSRPADTPFPRSLPHEEEWKERGEPREPPDEDREPQIGQAEEPHGHERRQRSPHGPQAVHGSVDPEGQTPQGLRGRIGQKGVAGRGSYRLARSVDEPQPEYLSPAPGRGNGAFGERGDAVPGEQKGPTLPDAVGEMSRDDAQQAPHRVLGPADQSDADPSNGELREVEREQSADELAAHVVEEAREPQQPDDTGQATDGVVLRSQGPVMSARFHTPGQARTADEASLRAPHHADGRFFLPWGRWPHSPLAFLRWTIARNVHDKRGNRPAPIVPNDGVGLSGREESASLTWVGHSTFAVHDGEDVCLTDPHFGPRSLLLGRELGPGIPLEAIPPRAFAVVSHNHYDHLDAYTVDRLPESVEWFVPLGLAKWFRARGRSRVVELDWWQSARRGRWTLTCLPSQHWSRRFGQPRNTTLWCSWLLDSGQRRYYFAGDTGYFHGFRAFRERFGPIDVAMLPIGAYEPRWFMAYHHMSPEEACKAFEDLGARYLVPMHWGTFDLTDEPTDLPPRVLREVLTRRGADPERARILAAGECFRIPD